MKIFIKFFKNDATIKKKVASKFGKMTAYSSFLWYNSPEYLGFKTLNQFLEGVKKKILLLNYRTFLNFFEIEVEISQDFSTKLGSNDSAKDSAYRNASKFTSSPSTPIIGGSIPD